MSRFDTLMARDGRILSVCFARPPAGPRGGVVIVQELCGLTAHSCRASFPQSHCFSADHVG